MRVGVVGAGAIGGWMAARLALAGHEVGVLARGATLEALRTHGQRLQIQNELITVPVDAAASATELGPRDLVVIAVKGPSLSAVADQVAAMCGPDTLVLPAMNGVPWWFLRGLGGDLEGPALETVDPGGRIARLIPANQVIGCVVHAACATAEPGLVRHAMGRGLIIGEPGQGPSERLDSLGDLLSAAGFDVTVSDHVQRDIWYKLWGNMTMNPVSALTGATCDIVLDDPLVAAFIRTAMREAQAIGNRIGCPIDETPEDRHLVTRRLGAFKTSMLQDVEAGRPIELDALVAAPREIAQRLGMETPAIDALLGLTRLMGRSRGLYG